jgi:hypothetical protein
MLAGVSLRPPAGGRLLEQTNDGARARWVEPGRYDVALLLRRVPPVVQPGGGGLPAPPTMAELAASTLAEMRLATDGSDPLSNPLDVQALHDPMHIPVDRRAAVLLSFRMSDTRQTWYHMQGMVRGHGDMVITLRMDCTEAAWPAAQPMFQAMFEGIELTDERRLAMTRRDMLAAGEALLEQLTPEAVRQAVPADRWVRLRQGERVAGYQRMRHSEQGPLGIAGLTFRLDTHLAAGPRRIDATATAAVDEALETEVWSERTTVRPTAGSPAAAGPGGATGVSTWAQTGLRSGNVIEIERANPPPATLESYLFEDYREHRAMTRGGRIGSTALDDLFPQRAEEVPRPDEMFRLPPPPDNPRYPAGQQSRGQWTQPRGPFLPQAYVQLLPLLLPAPTEAAGPATQAASGLEDAAAAYAFWAYHPQTSRLTLRTYVVQPQADGGYVVLDRPALDRGAQRWVFDAAGRWVRREMPNGDVLEPASAQQMQELARRLAAERLR